jgi:hypothetical protein
MARPSRSVSSGEESTRRQCVLLGRTARCEVTSVRCLAVDRLERIRDLFDEVAGDHAGRSETSGGEVTRRTM